MSRRQVREFEGCLSAIFRLFGMGVKEETPTYLPYRTKESILTAAENRFYLALIKAIDNKAVILPKVGLQDVFAITDKEHYISARNRISTRHIDFLVCEVNTLRPLFGVELDDSSHNKAETQKHDLFKNQVFENAHLSLVRVAVKQNYNVEELKAVLQTYFKKEETVQTPICPNCKIPMVRRTARQGEHKGQDFWACPNYPTCKELINIPISS